MIFFIMSHTFESYFFIIINWNFNNLNAKDPVAMGLFSQKELVDAIEKAERRIKREKREKEKAQNIK